MFNLTINNKPVMGKLIEVIPGHPVKVLEKNKPFPILQDLKKSYIQRGHKKANLKITY